MVTCDSNQFVVVPTVDPAVTDMGRKGCAIAAQLDQGQRGRHVFSQDQSVLVSVAVDGGDNFFEMALRIAIARRGWGRTESLQVCQGRTAGDITGIEAPEAVGYGEDPGLGKDQQVVFIAPANAPWIGRPGISHLRVEHPAISFYKVHLSLHLLKKRDCQEEDMILSEP
jgi:hypothetical protein